MPPPSNTEVELKLVGTGLQSQVNPAELRCDFYCISNKIKKTVLFAKVPISVIMVPAVAALIKRGQIFK